MFEFNPFALPPFFSSLLIITIGIYVLARNPHSEKHRSLFYFCLSCFIWLIFYTAIYLSKTEDQVLTFAKFACAGVLFIPFSNLYFNVTLLKLNKRVFLYCILAILLTLAGFVITDHFYIGSYTYVWGKYPRVGSLHAPFLFLYMMTWLYGLLLLHREMLRKKKKLDVGSYHQIRNVFLAWCGAFLGIVDFLPKYGIHIYPFAYLVALYWVFICALSIMQHKISKIVYAISRWFLIYSVFSVCFVLIQLISYFIIDFITSIYLNFSMTALVYSSAILLGAVSKPMINKIESVVDSYFFYEYYSRTSRLGRLAQNTAGRSNLDVYCRSMLRNIYDYFKTIKVSIYLKSDDNKFRQQCTLHWGRFTKEHSGSSSEEVSFVINYLSKNRYILIDNLYKSEVSSRDKAKLITWMSKMEYRLCIPIKSDVLYGVLGLSDKESGLPYNSDEIDELLCICDMLSIAAKTNFLIKAQSQMTSTINMLQEVSCRDSMTKLYNNAKSKEMASRFIKKSIFNHQTVSIIIADIDHFKGINDSYGHPAGDKVIVSFANLVTRFLTKMRKNSGSECFAGRLGGEEFIVVVANLSGFEALNMAEKLISEIRSDRVDIHNNIPINYTVSMGIASYPNDGISVDSLMLKADEMLYLAKRSGRNRIVLAGNTAQNAISDF